MINKIFKYIKEKTCTHPNVETNKILSYCPDCGKLIHINWYIIRCKCCGKKRIGILQGKRIIPIAQFCTNCGSKEYIIEKINSLSYFDINFAVAIKEEENVKQQEELDQSWIDDSEILNNLRYLPQYLN